MIAHSLGRLIDPKGHARDDARAAKLNSLNRECPTCGARPHYECHTLTTLRPTQPHAARRA